jgi:hypothetical protein
MTWSRVRWAAFYLAAAVTGIVGADALFTAVTG